MRVIVEGMAGAKALGQVCSQYTAGTAWNSVWLESSVAPQERGVGEWERSPRGWVMNSTILRSVGSFMCVYPVSLMKLKISWVSGAEQ